MFAHEEIAALITAIGAGMGEEFDSEKLRYHRIIIMTDADIDGAHIRTLLLTFFFRNMRQLIDEGFLYIAQPPLYKASKGRRSNWLYADADLDNWMAERVFNGLSIASDDEDLAVEVKGKRLGSTITQLREFREALDIVNVLGMPEEVFFDLLRDPELQNLTFTRDRSSEIIGDLDGDDDFENGTSFQVGLFNGSVDEEQTPFTREVNEEPAEEHDDSPVTYRIRDYELTEDVYNNPAIRRSKRLYQDVMDFIAADAFQLKRREDVLIQDLAWRELPEALEENSDTSGINIQRYKGLGEMNPDQLWDTTMNPQHRVMLQVTAEDAISADDIFRTLMGEEVGPRRDFIRANALEVKNLDV